jgi:hypothetical protein
MDMKHEHGASTNGTDIDLQHIYSMEMQSRHEAKTCRVDMKQRHAVRTCRMDMEGHAHGHEA